MKSATDAPSAAIERVGVKAVMAETPKGDAKVLADCPTCHKGFLPKRNNQSYCSKGCQKNASRGSRLITDSPTERRRTHEHYNRAYWLGGDLYTLPPDKRLGFIAQIIEWARMGDASLRNILTDPKLLKPCKEHNYHHWRKRPKAYRTIAQAADAYCWKFWACSVREVVNNNFPEPATGEVC
jgi:hypothetical protein